MCGQEFGGIVTFAQSFFLFFARLSKNSTITKKNWRRRRQEICPVPVQSKKRFYSQQLLIILKKQNAFVLLPEKSILNFLSSTHINEMFFLFFSLKSLFHVKKKIVTICCIWANIRSFPSQQRYAQPKDEWTAPGRRFFTVHTKEA